MEILCAPAGLSKWEFPGQGVQDIARSAFRQAMLDMALLFPLKERQRKAGNSAWRAERYRAMADFAHQFAKCGVQLPLAYALHWGEAEADWPELTVYQEGIAECIKLAGESGCRQIVIRPWQGTTDKEVLWQINKELYLTAAEQAEVFGLRILLENQSRSINGHLVRGILSEAAEAVQWVDELNAAAGSGRFGFCLNMGNSGPCGLNVYDLVLALGKRLQAVIICDSDATGDRQLLPFTGAGKGACETDWLNVIRSLREIGFDGLLVLNMRDTAAAFPPLLRPQLMKLAEEVVRYILWQIDMEKTLAKYEQRVLFGAGNMCRNYMSCYGEKYPPLFTCDNNSKVWGQEVCGLTVHNPKDLRDLPSDCAIFICNIYYREIEAQLQEMGLKNPIEFFNDECLSTMYAGKLPEEGF